MPEEDIFDNKFLNRYYGKLKETLEYSVGRKLDEEEIDKVKKQIEISNKCGRELWAEKNKTYLDTLEKTLEKVREYKLVHKNGKSREEV